MGQWYPAPAVAEGGPGNFKFYHSPPDSRGSPIKKRGQYIIRAYAGSEEVKLVFCDCIALQQRDRSAWLEPVVQVVRFAALPENTCVYVLSDINL